MTIRIPAGTSYTLQTNEIRHKEVSDKSSVVAWHDRLAACSQESGGLVVPNYRLLQLLLLTRSERMSFMIKGLKRELFKSLFLQSTSQLAAKSIVRKEITEHDGAPCRLSLADLEAGESALLLNYQHLPDTSPFHSSHAIYLGENRKDVRLSVDEVPEVMECRLLSVRFFGQDQMMLDADVVDGVDLRKILNTGFQHEDVAFIDIHYAKPGCWAARAQRVAA